MDVPDIAQTLEQFLRTSFGIPEDDPGFSRSVDLYEAGYVDSVGVTETLAYIRGAFSVDVPDEALLSEAFATIDGMALVVAGLLSGEGLASTMRGTEAEAQGRSTAGRRGPQVRPVAPPDVEPLCHFLERGFAGSGIAAAAWRRLFDHGWDGEAPNPGFVLTAGDEIVGFLGVVQALRRVGDKAGLVCNFSSWYVLPEYRGWGTALVAAATRARGLTYTNLTPTPATLDVFTAFGFAEVNTCKIFMPPLLHAETLRGTAPVIHFDSDAIRRGLNDQQRRVFDDHAPHDCLQILIKDGPDYAHLVLKRRVWRRLSRLFLKVPYSEVLHCSAPPLLARHLERVKLAVLRRQKTVALVADARLLPVPPRGLPRAARAYYRSPIFDAGDIDKLYSEFVLLPV